MSLRLGRLISESQEMLPRGQRERRRRKQFNRRCSLSHYLGNLVLCLQTNSIQA